MRCIEAKIIVSIKIIYQDQIKIIFILLDLKDGFYQIKISFRSLGMKFFICNYKFNSNSCSDILKFRVKKKKNYSNFANAHSK